jgi:hypothetical protein
MYWILEQIVKPMSHRLGTMAGAYIATLGYVEHDVNLVVNAVPLAVGIVFDLFVRKLL